MKRISLYFISGLIIALCLSATSAAQDNTKLAQTGLQFLSVASDARGAALADALTSTENQSSSLFFNPAGMANMPTFIDVTASRNEWIADIQHHAFSLAIKPAGGSYGVLGFSVQSVDYGEVLGTRVARSGDPQTDIDKGYVDTGTISPSALAFGVGYAKALSDRFSVGGQVKWVRQSLGESVIPETDSTTAISKNEVTPWAFDFGTLFKTGFKSLAFGMSVRNFSEEIEYSEEGFQLPLVFTMGISMNLMDVIKLGDMKQSAILAVDATHDRSHPEQLKIGVDYKLVDILSLRGGYVFNNDEDNVTFGFGVSQFGFALDYAYTPFGVFDNVQRVTARFAF
jgi:hypothetical protein